jgi:hypothetical protein
MVLEVSIFFESSFENSMFMWTLRLLGDIASGATADAWSVVSTTGQDVVASGLVGGQQFNFQEARGATERFKGFLERSCRNGVDCELVKQCVNNRARVRKLLEEKVRATGDDQNLEWQAET